MNDLISVIVPVYNVEKYLEQCVDSIINQTYTNLEIILVDDGSIDNSPQICDDYASIDSRIRVYHKKNGGLSDARNIGISKTNGKYITFIDSDDFVDSRFIEILYLQIQETGAQISCVGMQWFYSGDRIEQDKRQYKNETLKKEAAIVALLDQSEFQNYVCNKMFCKELFRSIVFPYRRKMEDLAITYQLIERCDLVSYNPVKLYFYYQRANSITRSSGSEIFIDYYLFSKERYLYIKKKYPEMVVNYQYFNNVIIDCYPFLSEEEMDYAKSEFKKNRHYGLIKSNWKMKLKFVLFILNKPLYCFLRKVQRKSL